METEPGTLDKHICITQSDLRKLHRNKNHDSECKYLIFLYGKSKPISGYAKKILEYDIERAINKHNQDDFFLTDFAETTNNANKTIDGEIDIEQNCAVCKESPPA